MWIATSMLVCALSVMHRGPHTFPTVTLLDVGPIEASAPDVIVLKARRANNVDEQRGNLPALVRVRSENPSIAAVIRDATGWSTTFRRLIETIEATDGLVYVEEGRCGHSVRACLVLSVQVAGPFRLLRILINSRGRADCEIMASIGHELQHAIEVLRDPHVTDMRSAYWFFDREGRTGSGRFETAAAIHVGLQVSVEACAHAKGR